MIIAVSGSRTLKPLPALLDKLLAGLPVDEIRTGDAPGVDAITEAYCGLKWIDHVRYVADWKTHGRKAGAIRNAQMLDGADMLIAIWDGKSPGTRIAIDIATRRQIPMLIHTPEVQPMR